MFAPDLNSQQQHQIAPVAPGSSGGLGALGLVVPVKDAIELLGEKLVADLKSRVGNEEIGQKVADARNRFNIKFFRYIRENLDSTSLNSDPKQFLALLDRSGLLARSILHFKSGNKGSSIESNVTHLRSLFRQLAEIYEFNSVIATQLLTNGNENTGQKPAVRAQSARLQGVLSQIVPASVARYINELDRRPGIDSKEREKCIAIVKAFVEFVFEKLKQEHKESLAQQKQSSSDSPNPVTVYTLDDEIRERGSNFVAQFIRYGRRDRKINASEVRTCLEGDYLSGLRAGNDLVSLPSFIDPLAVQRDLRIPPAFLNGRLPRFNTIFASIAQVHQQMDSLTAQLRRGFETDQVSKIDRFLFRRDDLISRIIIMPGREIESGQNVLLNIYALLNMKWSDYDIVDKSIRLRTGEDAKVAKVTLDDDTKTYLMQYRKLGADVIENSRLNGWGKSSLIFPKASGATLIDDSKEDQQSRYPEFATFRNQLITALVRDLRIPFHMIAHPDRSRLAKECEWVQIAIGEKKIITVDLSKLGQVGDELVSIATRYVRTVLAMVPAQE